MILNCSLCDTLIKKKPSEVRERNYCSTMCYYEYINSINIEKRYITKFFRSTWTNMNVRAGIYRQNTSKNRCYKNINIEFSREEYKQFCFKNQEKILTLKRPSLDRIDSKKNYSLDNIQIIELDNNIRKKRFGCKYFNGPSDFTKRGIRLRDGKWEARITFKSKGIFIGMYNTQEEAYNAFYNKYVELRNRKPW